MYTRANCAQMQGLRGAHASDLTEKQYDIIDVVGKIATECNTDSCSVALAWLKAQSGVRSAVIGARTLEQLEANLKALDLTLTPEQIASLNNVSKPVLNFPADFVAASQSYGETGTTINGIPSQLIPLVPKDDSSRW
jgi:aryl-alcohol dehydrogenase-like predicted oxidoreductase